MRKILISIIGVATICSAFAAGENIATSKAFVDAGVAQKQDAIPANNGTAAVLTNTGTPGSVGTKNIYDSNASYSDQTDSLVTADDFNTAVQNAIDTEFECIAWRDPNDHTSDCMLVQIRGITENQSKNLFDINQIPARVISSGGRVLVNNGDGTLTVQPVSGNSAVSTELKLSQLAPDLVIGKTYTLNFNTTGTSKYIYLADPVRSSWFLGTSKTITQDMLDAIVSFYGSYPDLTPQTISNIQIEEGTVATEYVPYGNVYMPSGD